MPVSVNSFEKIFCRYNVFLLPCLAELWPDNLHIVLKLNFLFLVFKKEPNKDKFLIEILSWFENFNNSSLFRFQIFHIKNVGNKSIGHLPWRVDFDEIGDIIVDWWEKLILNGRFVFLESFAWNKLFTLFCIILLKFIKIYFTHFSLNFSLNIQCFLKLLIAVLKFYMVTILSRYLFVSFDFLFPKYLAEFLSHYHQWFKCFLNCFSDSLNEWIVREDIFRFGNVTSLKHFLPYLVWRHKEAYANSFNWNILGLYIYLSKLSCNVFFHSFIEFFYVRLIESELSISFIFIKVGDRMMMEPYLKKIHENLSTWCIRFK